MAQSNTPVTGEKAANPVTMAIYVAIGAIVMVIGIILLASYAVHSHKVGANVAVSEKTTLSNIAPLSTVVVDATKGPVPSLGSPKPAVAAVDAPVVAMAIPTALPPGTVVAKPAGGKGVYEAGCNACHAAGIAGAPKSGDKVAWAPRLAKGAATLYDHAIKGVGAMPAKGGNSALADADVKAAVDYMMAANK
jgi:cytochrome c5